MNPLLDALLVLLILANLRLLGSNRIAACIQTVAFQALLLGLLPLCVQSEGLSVRLVVLCIVSTAIKGGVLPWLLRRNMVEANVNRESQPIVGLTTSLLVGLALLGMAVYLGHRLPLPGRQGSTFLIPVALFTLLAGLFLIVARVKAVMQVLGYLAMENGIYAFGLAFAVREPLLVEMGILLDVFAAVFIMGVTIHHLSRELDHIDTDRLSTLRDG